MKKINKEIIIGVDGGGTKTDVLVSDLNGKILSKSQGGSSNLRDIGIEKSIFTVSQLIEKSLSKIKQKKVLSVFVGLPAFAEEFKLKEKEIRKEFSKHKKRFFVSDKELFIGSDQEVAFRSGTDEKEGVVVISGTGSVVRGWKGKKQVKCSGWGWITDKGGAYWVGKKAYEETVKSLDGRAKRSILTDLIMEKLKIKNINDLNEIIYQDSRIEKLSSLSFIAEQAIQKNDKVAENIFKQGIKELILSTTTVINKLKFKKEFPLVLIGGMFNSEFYKKNFEKEIKKLNSNALLIFPDKDPVFGAVKLAKEKLYDRKTKKS